jgi:alpha-glucosidase (family GH31 glycosyl hydrolase)
MNEGSLMQYRSWLLALALPMSLSLATACPGAPADAGVDDAGTIDELRDPPRHTPRWAFRPWISKDISDGPDTRAFVAGFQERDIPVGVVVLDSPWETNYNTFIPNPSRYPNFENLVDDLLADDIRLVLWVTQMVNESSYDLETGGDFYDGESPNYREGARLNHYVNDGETYFWWKGYGAALDFFSKDARDWWHAQQDALLDMGIAGWKLDFGEQYITTFPIRTADGDKTLQEYSEEYYADFLRYGVKKRGLDNFVNMVRAHDASYGFAPRFYARPEHAPVAWMGDNYQNDEGLADALDHMFESVNAGYVVVGSDIGGYLDRKLDQEVPFDIDVFLRWTAMACFTPFFQLHGRANITPWTVPERADESIEWYRLYASTHDALVPFFYSLAEETYAGREPNILRLVTDRAGWAGDYRFLVGDALLVAPYLDGTHIRDVELPLRAPGDATTHYIDLFDLGRSPLAAGTTLVDETRLEAFALPVFIRSGAIVPMSPVNDALPFPALADHDVILAYAGAETSTFPRHDDDGEVTLFTLEKNASATTLSTDRGLTRPTLVFFLDQAAMVDVTLDDTPLQPYFLLDELASLDGKFYDATRRLLVVSVAPRTGPIQVRTATP